MNVRETAAGFGSKRKEDDNDIMPQVIAKPTQVKSTSTHKPVSNIYDTMVFAPKSDPVTKAQAQPSTPVSTKPRKTTMIPGIKGPVPVFEEPKFLSVYDPKSSMKQSVDKIMKNDYQEAAEAYMNGTDPESPMAKQFVDRQRKIDRDAFMATATPAEAAAYEVNEAIDEYQRVKGSKEVKDLTAEKNAAATPEYTGVGDFAVVDNKRAAEVEGKINGILDPAWQKVVAAQTKLLYEEDNEEREKLLSIDDNLLGLDNAEELLHKDYTPAQIERARDLKLIGSLDTAYAGVGVDTDSAQAVIDQKNNGLSVQAVSALHLDMDYYALIPDEERDTLAKIIASGDVETANMYASAICNEAMRKASLNQEAESLEFASNHPLLARIKASNIVTQFAKTGEFVRGEVGSLLGESYASLHYMSKWTNDAKVINQISDQNIRIKNPESFTFGGKEHNTGDVLAWLNSNFVSMGESAQRMWLGGLGLVLGAGSAGSDYLQECYERGCTTGQAAALGMFAAAAEIVTEKVSLDALFHHRTGGNFLKSIWEVLKQAGTEGLEEVGSDVINEFADWLIMQDENMVTKQAKALMKDNPDLSESDAYWNVLFSGWGQSFAGGAFSGLFFGSAEQTINVTAKGGWENVNFYQKNFQMDAQQHAQYTRDIQAMGLDSETAAYFTDFVDSMMEDPSVLATGAGVSTLNDLANVASEVAGIEATQADISAANAKAGAASIYDTALESAQQDAETAVDTDRKANRRPNKGGKKPAQQNVVERQAKLQDDVRAIFEEAHAQAQTLTEARLKQEARAQAIAHQKERQAAAFQSASQEASAAQASGDTAAQRNAIAKMRELLTNVQDAVAQQQTQTKLDELELTKFKETAEAAIAKLINHAGEDYAAYKQEAAVSQAMIEQDIDKTLRGENADVADWISAEGGETAVQEGQGSLAEGEGASEDAVRDWGNVEKQESSAVVRRFYQLTGGDVTLKPASTVSQYTEARAEQFKQKTGKSVAFYTADGGPDGTNVNGNIYVRKGASASTMFHEFAEVLCKSNQEFNDQVEQAVANMDQDMLDRFVSAYRARDPEFLQRFSDDFIKNEFFPDLYGVVNSGDADVENLFATSEEIENMTDEERDEFVKAVDDVVAQFSDLTGNFGEEAEATVDRNASKNTAPQESEPIRAGGDGPAINPRVDTVSEAETDDEVADAAGIKIDDTGAVSFSLAYVPSTQEEAEKVAQAISGKSGVDIGTARKWVKSELSVGKAVAASRNLNYEPDERYTAIKSNAEYPSGTVDLTNNCVKRHDITEIFDYLQNEYKDRVFTCDELEQIRQILLDAGYPAPCAGCFVEERRKALGGIAKEFIDAMTTGYDGTNASKKKAAALFAEDGYMPSIADLITYDSCRELYKNHPKTYEAWTTWNNSRGMSAGRLLEGRAEYKREILKWTPSHVQKVNNLGGLRIFSFSDFEGMSMLDIIQIMQDCARMGVSIHGYTKVPAFARFAAMTGAKINCSHIPPKSGKGFHYENGVAVLDFDPNESFDDSDPDLIGPDGNNVLDGNHNIGNNVIGINDEQISVAMLDPNITQIIGFHTNDPIELQEQKGTRNWTNYKEYQNEVYANGTDKKGRAYSFDPNDRTTWHKADNINFYIEVINAAEEEGHPIENAEQFVTRFLQVCKEKGLIPRYWQFLDTNENGDFVYRKGYEKHLVDFPMFDPVTGEYYAQKPITADFDDDFNQLVLMKTDSTEEFKKTPGYMRDRMAVIDRIKGEVLGDVGQDTAGTIMEQTLNGPSFSMAAPVSLESRLSGDALEDAKDLIDEVRANEGEVDDNGYITVYHRTSKKNADAILKNGIMTAKEDGLFFSTKEDSDYNSGYGDSVVKLRIPAEELVIDDEFGDEAHLRLPLGRSRSMDVSEWIDNGGTNVQDEMVNGVGFEMKAPGTNNQNEERTKNTDSSLTSLDEVGHGQFEPRPYSPQNESAKKPLRFAAHSLATSGTAEEIGIPESILSGLTSKVKKAVSALSLFAKGVSEDRIIIGNSHGFKLKPGNLGSYLAAEGIFAHKGNSNESVYFTDGNITVRISKHHASASHFRTKQGLSIAIISNTYRGPNFVESADNNAIEAVYYADNLSNNRERFAEVIRGIAKVIATGDVTSLPSADSYNYSGSSKYKEWARKQFEGNSGFSMRAPSTIEDAVLGAEIGNRRKQAAIDSTAQARAEQRMLRNQQVAEDMALAGQMSDMRKEAARSRRTQQELQDRLDTQAARAEQNLLRQDQTALGRQMGDTRTALDRQRRQIENDAMRGMSVAEVRGRTEQRERMKASATRKASIEEIRSGVRELYKWRTRPNGKKGQSVPTFLNDFVDKALSSIDLGSESTTYLNGKPKGSKQNLAWREIIRELRTNSDLFANASKSEKDAFADVEMPDWYKTTIADLDKSLSERNVEYVQDMTQDELEQTKAVIGFVKAAVTTANVLHANQRYASIQEAGEALIDLSKQRKAKRASDIGIVNGFDNLVNTDMLSSFDFFRRLGPAGKSISKSLSKGFEKYFGNVRTIQSETNEAIKTTGVTERELNDWSDYKKSSHEFTLESGETIGLTTGQLMELYALTRRGAAYDHLFGKGIKVKNMPGNQAYQNRTFRVTEGDVDQMLSALTPKQKAITEKLQTIMSTTLSAMGNEVTQAQYMYDGYNEDYYWTMSVDDKAHDKQEPGKERSFNALINASFTNALVKSNAALTLGNAIDTFAQHAAQMAAYNGVGLPIQDLLKIENYRTRGENGVEVENRNVQQAITDLVGDKGLSYITTLIKDINGLSSGSTGLEFQNKILKNVKSTAVSGKLRVVIQQPTAIIRAMSMINPTYFLKQGNLIKNIKEMQERSDLAYWKDQGNFDIGTGRSIYGILFGDRNLKEKAMNALNAPAGAADNFGWGQIWGAVKAEVAKQHPDVEFGSDEFFELVNDRFSDVINNTQVIDTLLHRSQIMRSKDGLVKMSTSFMNEPIKTFNMVNNAIYDVKNGEPGAKKRLASNLVAVAASTAVNSLVLALHDALKKREPEEPLDELIAENFKSGFVDGINPLGMIPYVSQIKAIVDGYKADSLDLGAVEDAASSIERVWKWVSNGFKSDTYTNYGMIATMFKNVGNVIGIPMNGVLSSLEAIANAIVPGALADKKLTNKQQQRISMVRDAGVDKKAAKHFMSGYSGAVSGNNSAADKALYLATFDDDGDGRPDFNAEQQQMIADILDIKTNGEDLTSYAEAKAISYLKDHRKDAKNDMGAKKFEDTYNVFEDYFEMLGLDGSKLPTYDGPDKLTGKKAEMSNSIAQATGINQSSADAFVTGYNGSTNAEKALQVLAFDEDGNGEPDWSIEQQNLIAETLGINTKGEDLTTYASEQAVSYLKKQLKKYKESGDAKSYAEKYNAYVDYFNDVGLDPNVLPKWED